MRLEHLVRLECCVTDFSAPSKSAALRDIAAIMEKAPACAAISAERIFQGLQDRESKGSTGFTNGIAIPHCQLPGLAEFVVGVIISKKGVGFDSMDKKKTRIFVVILGPEEERSGHLQLLAQVSRVLKEKETVDLLVRSTSRTALLEAFLKNAYVDDLDRTRAAEKNLLMLLVVRDEETMEEITELFVEYGIQEAIILDAEKMENLLTKIPLFLGFFNFTEEQVVYNRLVLTKINEQYINAIIGAMKDKFGDLSSYAGLSVHVLNLFLSIGF